MKGACVVDLGASPGGFSLVAAKAIRVDKAMNKWQSLLRISPHDPPRQISRTLGGSQITRPYGQVRRLTLSAFSVILNLSVPTIY